MDKSRALEIINALASGVDPTTGEIFPPQSTLQQPEIVRALYVAGTALSGGDASAARARNPNPPGNAGAAWTPEEDRALLTAFDQGRSEKELADTHQRTRGAIRARLIRHGRIEAPPLERVG